MYISWSVDRESKYSIGLSSHYFCVFPCHRELDLQEEKLVTRIRNRYMSESLAEILLLAQPP